MAVACGSLAGGGLGGAALAQVAVTLNGPPIQMRPYVPEPGVPLITINPGTPNPFPGDGGTGGSGTGGDGTGGSDVSGSDPLNTLMAQPWGIQAVTAVASVGVNPSAVAATCVLESGCQNLSGGTYTGAFQMGAAAFHDGLQTALAANPALASEIVQGDAGRMDPLTSAIATAGYQMQAVQILESAGVSNPTVLDTRGYFNFGPSGGALATASDDQLMSQVMPNVSQGTFESNGVAPGETVGQWKSAVSAKIGNAAGQPVQL